MLHDSTIKGNAIQSNGLQDHVVEVVGLEVEKHVYQPCILPLSPGIAHSQGALLDIVVPLDATTQSRLGHSASQSSVVPIIQTAWSLVLTKYTGNEDVSFGYLQSAPGGKQDLKCVHRATLSEAETLQTIVAHFENCFEESKIRQARTNGEILSSETGPLFNSIITFSEGSYGETIDPGSVFSEVTISPFAMHCSHHR